MMLEHKTMERRDRRNSLSLLFGCLSFPNIIVVVVVMMVAYYCSILNCMQTTTVVVVGREGGRKEGRKEETDHGIIPFILVICFCLCRKQGTAGDEDRLHWFSKIGTRGDL